MDRPGALTQLRAGAAGIRDGVSARCAPAGASALSGGPDSLALAAAAVTVLPTTALIIDHGLQRGSAAVADTARTHALSLGCVAALVIQVEVGTDGGPEAAARTARYAALRQARDGAPVLIGHTLDDQAETVLLGLGRGSGPRSIAGIRPYDPPWCRPLLGVRRSVTEAACAELGIEPWQDPHNATAASPAYGCAPRCCRCSRTCSAAGWPRRWPAPRPRCRRTREVLDGIAGAGAGRASGRAPDCRRRVAVAGAVRRRVIRGWLLAGGAMRLTDKQILGVDALVTTWRGQGGVAVGSDLSGQRLVAGRRNGVLTLSREPV